MIFFFGSKEVNQESDIDEYKISGRIRPVEYPLESLHPCPVYTMVDRWRSSEAPVGEVWRESEVQEDGFMEHKAYQESRCKSQTCREQEYLEITRNRSRKKNASVFCYQKSDEKLEIVSPPIYERRNSETIHEGDYNQISDICSYQIIQDIQFRESFFLEKIPRKRTKQESEKSLFKIIDTRYPKLASEKYSKENTPRKEDEENSKDTVEHEERLWVLFLANCMKIHTIRKRKSFFVFYIFLLPKSMTSIDPTKVASVATALKRKPIVSSACIGCSACVAIS